MLKNIAKISGEQGRIQEATLEFMFSSPSVYTECLLTLTMLSTEIR